MIGCVYAICMRKKILGELKNDENVTKFIKMKIIIIQKLIFSENIK